MKRWLIVFLLASLVGTGLAQEKKSITYQAVSNPSLLQSLLSNRFGLVESDVSDIMAAIGKGTGNIYYVDSGVGADTYTGLDWTHPKATLDAAVGLCTADRGDILLVAQGHSEALGAAADEVDIDVAGITIIGCGQVGNVDTMPYFDYTGDVTGAFAVGADGVTLFNLRFHANVPDVNEAVDIEAGATDCHILNCRFDAEAEGTDEFWNSIITGGAACHRLVVQGCEFDMGAGAAISAISLHNTAHYSHIIGNTCFGDCSTACIVSDTAASNHIVIQRNLLFNGTIGGNGGMNTEPAIELYASTSGIIADNYIVSDTATLPVVIVAADCFLFENYTNEDESSAATGALVGAASVANN